MLSRIKAEKHQSTLDTLVASVKNQLAHSPVNTPAVAQMAVSTESISDHAFQELNSAYESLSLAVEGIAAATGMTGLTSNQRDAAAYAGLRAGNIRSAVTGGYQQLQGNDTTNVVYVSDINDSIPSHIPAMEAYDETENRDAAAYSIVYNMQASTQDEFCEAFFPTIVNSPDQIGFTITIRLMNVYKDFQRQISGALDDYEKKNVIRAFADPTVLKSELTRVVPVVRAESLAMFTAAGDVAARTINLEGEDIITAPLLPGKRVNLLGISQTDTLLASGLMDTTDSLDPAIVLRYVYIKVGADVFKFNVGNLPLSSFNYGVQNNYRVQVLNFDTNSIVINKDTLLVDGTAPVTLIGVTTDDLSVRVSVNVTGQVNIERGDTLVNGAPVEVFSISDANGDQLALNAAPALAIVTAFSGAEVIGYELQAYRTNLNRRQRGQLIETTYYTQAYNIPLRSPITAIHPVTTNGQTDTSDLASLITVTRIRAINAGVGALISASDSLREYIDVRDTANQGPDVMGVGRFLVRPTYFYESIDMDTIVDSITSHQRAADMSAAIINKIRYYAYSMYRDSEYKAAADALAGGIAPKPTVVVGTDPVISQYVMVQGDMRTLSEEFNIRLVSTLDARMRGRMFISFINETAVNGGVPDPLSFGNFAYAPELTIVVPMSRNGQISKELAVSPRFLHVVHLPVLTELYFLNIPSILSKVSVNMHTVL